MISCSHGSPAHILTVSWDVACDFLGHEIGTNNEAGLKGRPLEKSRDQTTTLKYAEQCVQVAARECQILHVDLTCKCCWVTPRT